MADVFARLGFSNFDPSKFGTALELSPEAKNTLNLIPINITTWQIENLEKGSIIRTDYFQNPMANLCNQLTANIQTIISVCINDTANTFTPAAANAALELANTGNSAIIAINNFKTHTDNISGVSAITQDSYQVPFYEVVTSVGSQMVTILNKTDGISNTLPYLGALTSLYVKTELTANTLMVQQDENTVLGSLTPSGPSGNTSNLTASSINTISQHIQSVSTYLTDRRLADWAFYQNSLQVLRDYTFLIKFSNMGATQKDLMTNVIGTEYLKSKLTANT